MVAENPFVFGEIIDDANFVDRTQELDQLLRDLADGQKIFLLSPRRFGKSSLVAVAMLKLKKRHIFFANHHERSLANFSIASSPGPRTKLSAHRKSLNSLFTQEPASNLGRAWACRRCRRR